MTYLKLTLKRKAHIGDAILSLVVRTHIQHLWLMRVSHL